MPDSLDATAMFAGAAEPRACRATGDQQDVTGGAVTQGLARLVWPLVAVLVQHTTRNVRPTAVRVRRLRVWARRDEVAIALAHGTTRNTCTTDPTR